MTRHNKLKRKMASIDNIKAKNRIKKEKQKSKISCNIPSLSFFPAESEIHKDDPILRGNIEILSNYQDNENKVQYFGKKFHQMYLKTKDPEKLTELLLSYYNTEYNVFLNPAGLLLPSQESRNYFTVLSQYPGSYITLESVFGSVKSTENTLWDNTQRYIVAIGIAFALKSLHKMKRIHKRLTPSSVMLNSRYQPFIWDHYVDSIERSDIFSSFAQGIYQYVAPECLFTSEVTEKADVYSFGVILRQLLFNEPIYNPLHKDYAIYQLIQMGTTPKVEFGTDFYQYLTNICLEFEPSRRPSMDEVVQKLLDFKNVLFESADFEKINEYIKSIQNYKPKPPCTMEEVKQYFADIKTLQQEADSKDPQKQLKYGELLVSKLETKLGLGYLRQAALSNDSESMYKYALALSNAPPSDNDDVTAFHYFKQASEKGHLEATVKYAEFLRRGRGCTRNLMLSNDLYKSAADRGSLAGQIGYAKMCHDGEGKSGPNLRDWFKYTLKAAKHGGSEEIYSLGQCYHNAEGTTKNLRLALENYKLAADKGNLMADGMLANITREGIKLAKKPLDVFKKPHSNSDTVKSDTLIMYSIMMIIGTDDVQKDTKSAAKILKVAAQKGFAEAQFEYYNLLLSGDGVAKNDKEAMQYLQHSSQNGFNKAQLLYGNYLLQNNKISDAAKVYKIAADNGDPEASYCYAKLIYEKKLIKTYLVEALKYFNNAVEFDHAMSNYMVGSINQSLGRQHYQKALEYYKNSFRLGNMHAIIDVAVMSFELRVNMDKAKEVLLNAFKQKIYDDKIIHTLAKLCLFTYHSKVDEITLMEVTNKHSHCIPCMYFVAAHSYVVHQELFNDKLLPIFNSLSQNNSQENDEYSCLSTNILGYAYFTGKGVEQDKAKGIEYWKSVCERCPNAALNLAIASLKGEMNNANNNDINRSDAEEYYKKSIKENTEFPPAMFEYAEFLAKQGNNEQAHGFYLSAARQGHIPSMLKAALNYDHGPNGIEKVPKFALEYFKMVADVEIDKVKPQDWIFNRLDFVITDPFFKSHEDYIHDISLAMQRTGELLLSGESGSSNYELARYYFEKSRENNNPEATFQLGQIYEHGLGVPADNEKAKEYYEEASSKGHKFAKLYCSVPKSEREEIASLLDRFPNVDTEQAIEEILGHKDDGIKNALRSLMKMSLEEEEDDDYDCVLDDLSLITDDLGFVPPPLVSKPKKTCLPQMPQFDFISYIQSEKGSIAEIKPPFMAAFESNMQKENFPRRDGKQSNFKVSATKLNIPYQTRKPVFKLLIKDEFLGGEVLYKKAEELNDKNFSESLRLMRLSGDKGYGPALLELARMYKTGDRVEKDEKLAEKFAKLAEEKSKK